MSLRKEEPKAADIPDVVVDPTSQKRYVKGRFLGKVRTFLRLHRESVADKLFARSIVCHFF